MPHMLAQALLVLATLLLQSLEVHLARQQQQRQEQGLHGRQAQAPKSAQKKRHHAQQSPSAGHAKAGRGGDEASICAAQPASTHP